MNTFNLTFWGEIRPGQDPARVKARFAKLFDIRDPQRLEHFFSGERIILRRNLDRKAAAEYYAKLRKLGVEAELVKVGSEAPVPEPPPTPTPAEDDSDDWESARRKAEREVIQRARHDAAVRQREAEERRQLEAQRAEQERQFREQQARLEQQRREEEARREAERAEQQRQREEAAAQKRAEQAALRQRKAEEAARRKADKERARQAREAEAAKARAEALERKRREAEAKARRDAEIAEERRRKAKQQAAEKARAQAEAQQRRAEEEARRREEAARRERERAEAEALKKAEAEAEAARWRAAAEQRQREQAEEAARLEAEREAERQRKAELAAQRKAELAAARAAAERELARKKSEAAERKRQREAAAAREASLREADRQRAAELAAAEQARERALRRRAAQEKRQQRARERAEQEAAAAREQAQQQARQNELEEQRRAEREAIREKRQRAQAEREQRRAAERQRREQKRREELAREQAREAERQQLEERAITRGAAALTNQAALRQGPARVRSAMDLPRREKAGQGTARRRQPGAPNDYQSHPFRNTSEVRERAALAARQMRRSLAVATLVLAIALLLLGRYLGAPASVPAAGPEAVAAAPGGRLALLAGQQLFLHDRAGIGTETVDAAALGLARLSGPIEYGVDGRLLIWGAPRGSDQPPGLQRCDLPGRTCERLGTAVLPSRVTMAVHALTGQLFLVDGDARQVHKLDAAGNVLATVTLPMAPRPVLRLDAGLMFINSHEGPAIAVRRYENEAFGQQLDEVLLLPPRAMAEGQVRLFDFTRAGDYWWASMVNPDTGAAGLYVFDSQWKYLREIALPASHRPARLQAWGNRVLVPSPADARILRFSAAGSPEADYHSNLLDQALADQRWRAQWQAAAWAAAFALCLVLVCSSLAYTYWQYLRTLVFRGRPTRGAEPLDQFSSQLDWVDPVADRGDRLRRAAIAYAVLSLATLMLCVGLGASVAGLGAALLALAGPAIAQYLYARGNIGYAGASGETLALVDHRNMYHIASDARVQHRGPFLSIDDVVVFTGNRLLPAMDPTQVAGKLRAAVEAGARVDRKTMLVKLLEVRHPLALGALAVAAGLLGSVCLLVAASLT